MGKKQSYREWSKKILGFGKNKPADTPSEKPAGQPSASAETVPEKTSRTILVIDDSDIDRMILEELLGQAGYEVLLATDGEDGLQKFREHHPALVITDMIMPGKSGTEVIMEILGESPKTKLIAMSSGGELGPDVALAVAESINIHTVAKPFDPKAILKAVKSLLG